MTARGSPCTPCRFYDIPCSIPVDGRGKLAKATDKENAEETMPRDNDEINVYHSIGSVGKRWWLLNISQKENQPD